MTIPGLVGDQLASSCYLVDHLWLNKVSIQNFSTLASLEVVYLLCSIIGPQEEDNNKFANPVGDIAASSRIGDLFGKLASWGWAAV